VSIRGQFVFSRFRGSIFCLRSRATVRRCSVVQIHWMQRKHFRPRIVFHDFVAVVQFKAPDRLASVRPRPPDIDRRDLRGVSEADFLAQGIRAETSAAANRAVNLPWSCGCSASDFNPSPNRGAICFDSNQFQLHPMIRVARIEEQCAARHIT
jgi:hypothetical protein